MRRPPLTICFVCAALSCSASESPAGVGGDGDGDSGLQGDEDPSCADGYVVDGLGECRKVCRSTADCGDPALACDLNVGLCLPVDDVQCDPSTCPEDFVCPPDGGPECVPVDPQTNTCATDDDCPFGYRCDGNECVSRAGDIIMTCTIDADCGLLMTCQLGVCIGCVDDLQCGAGGQCVYGSCVVADLGPAGNCLGLTCSAGQRCNPVTGVCEPTCAADVDCPPGDLCAPVLNQCITDFRCTSEADCVPTTSAVPVMCVSGFCVGCTSSLECHVTETCITTGTLGGVCMPNLTADPCAAVTCGASESCDPLDGSCYPSNGTCAGDEDCRAGYTCNFLGLCSGCSVDGDCRPAQRCVFGSCVQIPQ